MKLSVCKFFLLLVVFVSPFSFSQTTVPFSVRYQTLVKGDMAIIANSIVDKVDKNANPSSFIVNFKKPRHNDEFQMGYIDIDNDETTFSSSSATLQLVNQSNKKIIYAGLYWSATYKYNSGYMVKEGTFAPEDKTREPFDKVKIKLPNQDKYVDIEGKLIFDGINEKKFKENSPYAVYADITKEVTELSNPFGEYTVANVKATKGAISGGVAAGWTIVFVYEDPKMSEKFISTLDGFTRVYNKSSLINYSGFVTPPQGNVKASIALGVLEGDNNLSGDQLFFKTNKTRLYSPLYNILREEENFFNSTITINNDNFVTRKPYQKDTYGFDVCTMNILNPDNTLIGNDCTEAEIKLKSFGDRCFLFFTAFNVEITSPEIETILEPKEELITQTTVTRTPNEVDTVVVEAIKPIELKSETTQIVVEEPNKTTAKADEVVVAVAENTNIIKADEIVVKVLKTEEKKTEVATNFVANQTQKLPENDIFNYNISGLTQGYYIIANVFAVEKNRFNFINFLKRKGLHPASFYNPIKKFHYVYLEKSENREEIVNLYKTKLNDSYSQEIWILAINKSNPNEAVAVKSESKQTNTPENKLVQQSTAPNQISTFANVLCIYNTSNPIQNENEYIDDVIFISDTQRRKYRVS